jgi:hypothetical protein
MTIRSYVRPRLANILKFVVNKFLLFVTLFLLSPIIVASLILFLGKLVSKWWKEEPIIIYEVLSESFDGVLKNV